MKKLIRKDEKIANCNFFSSKLLQVVIIIILGIFTFVIFIAMGVEKFKTKYIGMTPEMASLMESPTIKLRKFEGFPKEGSIVLSRFGGGDYFFFGKVVAVDKERKGVEVKYFDGDQEWKSIYELRYDTIKPGYRVEVRYGDKNLWIPGFILDRDELMFTIRLDIENGKKVRVKADSIRIKERVL